MNLPLSSSAPPEPVNPFALLAAQQPMASPTWALFQHLMTVQQQNPTTLATPGRLFQPNPTQFQGFPTPNLLPPSCWPLVSPLLAPIPVTPDNRAFIEDLHMKAMAFLEMKLQNRAPPSNRSVLSPALSPLAPVDTLAAPQTTALNLSTAASLFNAKQQTQPPMASPAAAGLLNHLHKMLTPAGPLAAMTQLEREKSTSASSLSSPISSGPQHSTPVRTHDTCSSSPWASLLHSLHDASTSSSTSGSHPVVPPSQQLGPSVVSAPVLVPEVTQGEGRHVCDVCHRSYVTESGLSKHKQTKCGREGAYKCVACERVYHRKQALQMHTRTHTKPCACKFCGKSFSRMWLLNGHIRTHTGEKPFQCEVCHRAFADRSNLRAHQQTHREVKKYRCTRCPKSFARSNLLHSHQRKNCVGRNAGGLAPSQPSLSGLDPLCMSPNNYPVCPSSPADVASEDEDDEEEEDMSAEESLSL